MINKNSENPINTKQKLENNTSTNYHHYSSVEEKYVNKKIIMEIRDHFYFHYFHLKQGLFLKV